MEAEEKRGKLEGRRQDKERDTPNQHPRQSDPGQDEHSLLCYDGGYVRGACGGEGGDVVG